MMYAMGYAISIMVSHNKLYIECTLMLKQHLTALSGFVHFWLVGGDAGRPRCWMSVQAADHSVDQMDTIIQTPPVEIASLVPGRIPRPRVL